MMAPIDYYAILGISRQASAADIRAAYKREVRIWRKRAAADAQASVRDEAMQRLTWLAEASRILLDTQRRAAYNRQPIISTTSVTPVSSSTLPERLPSDWVEQAESYLAAANYQAAAQIAREATANQGNEAQSWFVLSRANAGLQLLNDAVYEARRAVELAPENAMYHFNLGTIYEELGRWDEALATYEQASKLEPDELLYQLAIGGVWLQNGKVAKAMPIIKHVYATAPDDEAACFYYAQGLIAMAEAVPHDKSEEGYAVTSAEEIQNMRTHLDRAAGIKHLDRETKQTIRDTRDYLNRMEDHTFHIPLGTSMVAFGLVDAAQGGCVATMIMLFIVAVIFGSPLLLLLWSIDLLASGSILGGLFILACSAGSGYLWYRSAWVPRWKVNARLRTHRIRYLS